MPTVMAGPLKKNAMKKKKRKARDGSGAEDIDLGPSKKDLKKKRKADRKKKKNKRDDDDNGVIEF